MEEYTTVSGDTWDKIAHLKLGNAMLADTLMSANIEYVQFTIFPAGIKLTIPDIVETISGNLPPWKRDVS